MGTLEQCMKLVQSLEQRHQKDVIDVVLVLLLLTLNSFHTWCSGVSIVDFQQANAGWDSFKKLPYSVEIKQVHRTIESTSPTHILKVYT